MPARFVRPAATLLALALLVPATGAEARTRHRTPAHHTPAHHEAHGKTTHARSKGGRAARPSSRKGKAPDHHAAVPAGVTSVPGSGLKLFCPAHHNPLLIRKATQGAGTTVTVVCR